MCKALGSIPVTMTKQIKWEKLKKIQLCVGVHDRHLSVQAAGAEGWQPCQGQRDRTAIVHLTIAREQNKDQTGCARKRSQGGVPAKAGQLGERARLRVHP